MTAPARLDPIGLPLAAGVGFKPQHLDAILAEAEEGGASAAWFEVHAENYMGAGGPPHRRLAALRERFPLSLHGVGLSIGGEGRLDRGQLGRLRALIDRYEPASVSEHLAWSSHEGVYFSDLLPLPYDAATLARVAAHVDEAQEALGRRLLLENPSSYLAFAESTMDEIGFLSEVARRTGCGLLLDVANVRVSAANLGFDAAAWLAAFPVELVGEIHLAGAAVEADAEGGRLLIDSHDRPVDAAVWRLFAGLIARAGPLPTLIEWDGAVPDWPVLAAEAAAADHVLLTGGGLRACAV